MHMKGQHRNVAMGKWEIGGCLKRIPIIQVRPKTQKKISRFQTNFICEIVNIVGRFVFQVH